jgi:hypothetical protein
MSFLKRLFAGKTVLNPVQKQVSTDETKNMMTDHSTYACRVGGANRMQRPDVTSETSAAWESFRRLMNDAGFITSLCVVELKIAIPELAKALKRSADVRRNNDSFFREFDNCVYMLPSDFIGELRSGETVSPLGFVVRANQRLMLEYASVFVQGTPPSLGGSAPSAIHDYGGPITAPRNGTLVIALAFSPLIDPDLKSVRFRH